ncbi:GMC oxidoreductase [Amycolatopsis anabasis]|uniref:GMC oxidoreductase n=1 Tax=Amycolatopsis anabasis TaxID=1840409 RepID=UPI00131C2BDB|nr:GMC family oxidoreductase [Amycolatopsis anabasis]
MGGGTIGYELARLGRRVLYLERGHSTISPGQGIAGGYPEETFDIAELTDAEHTDRLARAGRNTEWYVDTTRKGKAKPFRPFVGSGTGGSSALYGMVTERFFREDFQPRGNFADVGDSSVPESWPIKYDELVPWYRKAEQLYRVRGTADPLRAGDDTDSLLPPRPMTAANAEVAEFLTERGMHPYNLHVACEYKDECQACQAFLCAADCKNHAGNICVRPAVRDHGTVLLDQTTVVRLEATRTEVTSVVARRNGETLHFRGKVVVLAASALKTPVLLLNSSSEHWPNGLANDNDLVGRNLMRHFVDLYLFRVRAEPVAGQIKEIGVNDFYLDDGQKFGALQSLGRVFPYDAFVNLNRQTRKLFGSFRWLADRHWQSSLQDRVIVMASITEDLPYHRNRILPGSGGLEGPGPLLELQYRPGEADLKRHRKFMRTIKASLGKYPGSRVFPMHLSGARSNSALGHQCGTCRFGDDPKTSVLDPDNRAWGLDNLYVVDTSMLPSSSGMNPSLTIAANALRVAQVIHGSL